MAHGPGRAGLDFGAMGRAGPIHCSIAHGLTFLKPARPIRSSASDIFSIFYFFQNFFINTDFFDILLFREFSFRNNAFSRFQLSIFYFPDILFFDVIAFRYFVIIPILKKIKKNFKTYSIFLSKFIQHFLCNTLILIKRQK
jgi:hypothetical protein